MGEVKLLGCWSSPFSRRVEMALKMKGVEYEYIEEDIRNKSPLLVELNPVHKKVPVLVHNGNPIVESLIILEYIDETWDDLGPPILPKDPYERAKARFWAKFVNDKSMSTMWRASWSRGEEREKAYKEAIEALQVLENELNGKKFFGGDNVGIVDIAANFLTYWSEIISEISGLEFLTKDKHPNLCRWVDEFCNCSFVKENLPPKDKLLHRFKSF